MSKLQARGSGSVSLVFLWLCPHQCIVIILGQPLGKLATTGQHAFLVTSSKKERAEITILQPGDKNPSDMHRYESIKANLDQVTLDQAGREMSCDD